MSWLLLPAGVVLVSLVVYDVFVTTVSAVGSGGPITGRLGRVLWRLLRGVARGPHSPVLAAAGTLSIALILVTWLLGLWAGWALIFAADPGAVVHADTGEPAGPAARVYFAGFALSTLGVGDYVPAGAPWQLLTVVAALNGFALLTMSASYLIPVVMAVTERRQLAMLLHGLGPDSHALLRTGWDGRTFDALTPHLHDLAPRVTLLAQRYLSYPVLHFFHSPERKTAIEPGLVALDEAVLVLEHGVAAQLRPHPATLRPLRAALDRLEELVADPLVDESEPAPSPPDLEVVAAMGIPVTDRAAFEDAVAAYATHRTRLAGLLDGALWDRREATPPAGQPSLDEDHADRSR